MGWRCRIPAAGWARRAPSSSVLGGTGAEGGGGERAPGAVVQQERLVAFCRAQLRTERGCLGERGGLSGLWGGGGGPLHLVFVASLSPFAGGGLGAGAAENPGGASGILFFDGGAPGSFKHQQAFGAPLETKSIFFVARRSRSGARA